MKSEVLKTLSTIPGFDGLDPASISIKRLGGFTNRNYKIDCVHGSCVLRLAGEGTSDYMDRKAEYHAASIATEAGFNAEIVHFNVGDGTMISRYIENLVTMDIERLRDLVALKRTARAIRRLHECGKEFQGQFEIFEQIDRYLDVIRELGAGVPDGHEELQNDAEHVRAVLLAHPLPRKPCHCDPAVENCIDNGERVHIVDFEYAGNNDPMWDLGDLSVEGDITVEQDHALLTAYFGHEAGAFDVGRMIMYKAMRDLFWILWEVVQHAKGNPAADFWDYVLVRLGRCRKLMASTDFPKHLEAVKRGP